MDGGDSFSDISTAPGPPSCKRCCIDETENDSLYTPRNMHIVKVLRNDSRGKCICLHAKFSDSFDKDAIVILQKSPFPDDNEALRNACVGHIFSEKNNDGTEATVQANVDGVTKSEFPPWYADKVVNNDIYHRFLVKLGLEKVNFVNMTVIHPAESHHFAKYSASRKRIVYETPDMYSTIIVPLLISSPRDLTWVDNILDGTAEVDRVLFCDPDKELGFTLVLDYRWDGCQLHELHCLALASSTTLTCLRDLRATHIPMLKKIMYEGRKSLVAKYGAESQLSEDQILAYFHYPPTFYRLHMHFAHVDGGVDGGTQAGKAHLAEDVIANLEKDSDFYLYRVMPIYLHENHAFYGAIRAAGKDESSATA